MRQSSSNEYYHSDALGSTLKLTDDSGHVTSSYIYEVFGGTISSGMSTNPFQYSGRENDLTGLYYYRARYYAPLLQRFISEDPIGYGGKDLNLYSYVGNNSLRFIDPLGLRPGDPYPSQDEAARTALLEVWAPTLESGNEYGGRITKRSDGAYTYSPPIEGTSSGVTIPLTDDTTAIYHSHPRGIFHPDENEDWSEDDREAVRKTGKDSYMITPSGRIKVLRGDGKSEGEIPLVKLRKPGPLGGRKDNLDE